MIRSKRVTLQPLTREDSGCIWRARHSTRILYTVSSSSRRGDNKQRKGSSRHGVKTLQRNTAQEKAPTPKPTTMFGQLLQIKPLANRHAPAPKQPLMQLHFWQGIFLPLPSPPWRPLPARRITCHGSEFISPQPFQDLFCRLHTHKFMPRTLRECELFGGRKRVAGCSKATADEEDVANMGSHVLLGDDSL